MKGTNNRNLIGAFLASYVGNGKPVIVTESSGEVTTGNVVGYSRGGYPHGAEQKIQEATVQLYVTAKEGTPEGRYNIAVANIKQVEEA